MLAQQDPKGRSLARRIKLPDVSFAYPGAPVPGEIRARQIQDGNLLYVNLLYVTCVCAVSLLLVFAIADPTDRIRKSLGAWVFATNSAVKPVLAVKPLVPALTPVP